MAQSDPHGVAQERPGEGDPAQQLESRTGSKRRRLSLDSTEGQSERLRQGDDSSEEEEEEEKEEDHDDDDDDDDDSDDDDGEDSVDGPGHNREKLKSLKNFVQELEDDVLPNDAIRRYSLYIESEKKAYFEAHKTEEWLRNKYHPSNLRALIERKKLHARTLATNFFLKLETQTPATGRCRTLEWIGSLSWTLEDESSAKPSLETRRLLLDIAQTQALALKLDTEKGIGDNILWPKNSDTHPVVKRLEASKLFVELLVYLWCAHGVVYYGMRESEENVAFASMPEDCKPSYEEDGWEEKLRSFWQLRLKGEDPLERRAATKDIEAAVDNALKHYVVKVEDRSMGLIYGCGVNICSRPFNSVESVLEHLRTRHLLLGTSLKEQLEGQFYYENYMRDPDAPVDLRNDEDPKSNDNQYVQEIRSGDGICAYCRYFDGCTEGLDARLPIQGHILEDHRDIVLGLPSKSTQEAQDKYPRENSSNAVAPAEKGSSINSPT